jgi:hypothetical protein
MLAMLVIRESQIKAFSRASTEDFKLRLRRHLVGLTAIPDKFPNDVFDAQVDGFIDLAKKSGIKTEADVAVLAELLYRTRKSFDILALSKHCQNVIYEYRVDPALKLERLKALLSPVD